MTDSQFSLLHVIVLGAAFGCFGSFTWSIGRFFVRHGKLGFGMRMIQVFGIVFMLAHLAALTFWFKELPATAAPALLLYAGALGLFWWAIRTIRLRPLTLAFSLDQPTHLVRTGPYRWVRHPLYTSYSMAWLGGVVATQVWWLASSLMIMTMLYWWAARQEESKFRSSDLADDYRAYVSRTGMFFPKPHIS